MHSPVFKASWPCAALLWAHRVCTMGASTADAALAGCVSAAGDADVVCSWSEASPASPTKQDPTCHFSGNLLPKPLYLMLE